MTGNFIKICLPLAQNKYDEAASVIFAHLAFPDDEEKQRDFFEYSMLIRNAYKIIGPSYRVAVSKAALSLFDRGLTRIIRERWMAGNIADHILGDASGMKSLNKMAQLHADLTNRVSKNLGKSTYRTDKKIIERIWSPSKSVMHMAVAFCYLTDSVNQDIYELHLETSWVAEFIKAANKVHREISKSSLAVTTTAISKNNPLVIAIRQ